MIAGACLSLSTARGLNARNPAIFRRSAKARSPPIPPVGGDAGERMLPVKGFGAFFAGYPAASPRSANESLVDRRCRVVRPAMKCLRKSE